METVEFTIDYPASKKGKSEFCRRYGLNAYYAGKHWAERKRDADTLHALTISAMNRCRVRKELFTSPVAVSFWWDDGLDVDNHAAIGKAILDACKGRIIADDDRRYVREIHHYLWRGGAIRVRLEAIKEDQT